jgi:uncharacterized protein
MRKSAAGPLTRLLPGGAVMADWGPMRLVISAYLGKMPQPDEASGAAREAFRFFEGLAKLKDTLKKRPPFPSEIKDPLALGMIESVLAVGDGDLTPMAAVAGTLADGVADFLFSRGMTKVVVDNGGDVAVRLKGEAIARVGIRSETDQAHPTHGVLLDSRRSSWGIATSGLGGRSLTRGVASAATVIAPTASLADASATAVANASFIDSPVVLQRPAEEIDPDTDLAGIPVTVRVGELQKGERNEALSGALRKAYELMERKIVLGAFVAVHGSVAMTDSFRDLLMRKPEWE